MRILRLDELSDSRILYEKRPPAFGFIIIAVSLLAIIVSVVWSASTVKPSVVQGSGVIESANRTEVMSSVTGPVLEVLTPNGAMVTKGDVMIRVNSPELSAQKESLILQSDLATASLALEDRYSTSLSQQTNNFSSDVPAESVYYYRYETLKSQIAKLRVDPPSMREIGYSETEIDNAIRSNRLSVEELRSSAMSAALERAAEQRIQLSEIEIRLAEIETGSESYIVHAAASGKVFLDPNLKQGTIIAAGQAVGTIASADGELTTRILVSAPDRQFVEVGDPVKVSVLGLPTLLYEKIEGVVSSIDSDITLLQDGSGGANSGAQSYFVVHFELDQYFTRDRAGERHPLGNGTAIQAELIYSETTYLQYFIELLGLV